jgi:hypothetical protein
MRRSEAPPGATACADTGAGLAVVSILSDISGFRIAFDYRDEVSPMSLTDSCVFSGFLDINVNDACLGLACG